MKVTLPYDRAECARRVQAKIAPHDDATAELFEEAMTAPEVTWCEEHGYSFRCDFDFCVFAKDIGLDREVTVSYEFADAREGIHFRLRWCV